MLKLSCAAAESGVDTNIFLEIVSKMLSLLAERQSEGSIVFVRHVAIHLVEEFGLYHPSSRGREMPLRFHRACRSVFECHGLVRLLDALLCCAANCLSETSRTVEALFECLGTILSWSTHCFFEEEVVEDECSYSFRVSGILWHTLLLEGVSVPGTRVTVDSLLRTWYSEGNLCGFLFNPVSLVELICQFCGITMESWSVSDRVNYGDRFLSLTCFVTRKLLSIAGPCEDARTVLPLAISGVRNIVENLGDIFTVHEVLSRYVSELSLFAKTLIEFDSRFPDDDGIMAALDKVLSCLFKLLTMTPCYDISRTVVAAAGMEVFNTFLSVKLSNAHSSEEAEYFSDTFTMSHLSLLGHLARSDPEQAAASLCLSLEALQRRNAKMEQHPSGSDRLQVQEGIWLVLKIIDAFLADACEGEEVSIPSCFTGSFTSGSHPVVKIVSTLMILMQEVVQNLPVASPALVSSLLEVFGTFIGVYVTADDGDVAGKFFFAQECIVVVSYVFNALRTFSFDEDVALAGCRVLDISVKIEGVAFVLRSSGILHTAEEMVTCGQLFYEDVRGRIAGFWIRCISGDTFSERIVPVLQTFDIHGTDFTSVDVTLCLERCSSLAGLFVSLQGSERLTWCFGSLTSLCDHVLSVSVCRFYEREVTIRTTELLLQLFLTCSVALHGEEVMWVLSKVRMTLASVINTIAEDPTWSNEGAEEEQHRLLKLISRLFCEVSRWVMMECTLPLELLHPLGTHVISSLGSFLKLFNEHSLSFPELRESAFAAFQLCAEAFTRDFVSHTDSRVFLLTLLFALDDESVDVQRVGITVAERVVTCLRDSGLKNHELFAQLLSTILRSFLRGKIAVSFSSQLARSLTTLCGCLPPESVELVLGETLSLCPEPKLTDIVREVMRVVHECVVSEGPRRQAVLRSLDESIADGLCNIRSVLLA
ncbi:trans-sialidase, putative [Trypanosoma cruzi marinkellei]|uniref:Trans-sialidase, putative n=1 Tax=Trypanosoma cruzi marinkellei TaxID=85056 RepID=K2MQ91_TRYCR|nr:trans-sialidase, putative [Trypanosoma cruzi marinkellei]